MTFMQVRCVQFECSVLSTDRYIHINLVFLYYGGTRLFAHNTACGLEPCIVHNNSTTAAVGNQFIRFHAMGRTRNIASGFCKA